MLGVPTVKVIWERTLITGSPGWVVSRTMAMPVKVWMVMLAPLKGKYNIQQEWPRDRGIPENRTQCSGPVLQRATHFY